MWRLLCASLDSNTTISFPEAIRILNFVIIVPFFLHILVTCMCLNNILFRYPCYWTMHKWNYMPIFCSLLFDFKIFSEIFMLMRIAVVHFYYSTVFHYIDYIMILSILTLMDNWAVSTVCCYYGQCYSKACMCFLVHKYKDLQ